MNPNEFGTILVTGAAGFIGFHAARRLLEDGCRVMGLDNLNPYYDVRLKEDRLKLLGGFPRFEFIRADVADRNFMTKLFEDSMPKRVIHLAAQAGVRYSLENPRAYVDSNISGFLNILEGCRLANTEHLVFASSSSVYGANTRMPFSEHHAVDHPVSLYAASKKADELMAHAYSHLYRLPCTGIRFFTVYGPWGRPDMALFLFTKAILEDRPIDVYNYGRMQRDFTYIDDVVEGMIRILERIPRPNPEWNGDTPDPASSRAPYRLYNLGNSAPAELLRFIEAIEKVLGRKARKNHLPLQAGDVPATCADVSLLERETGFRPRVSIEEGISRFVEWFREYYGL